jgi:hypothetical protein
MSGHARPTGPGTPRAGGAHWAQLALAVVRRPGAWTGALVALATAARPRWWASWPPWPVPDPDWWAMRMEVAYGRRDARPSADDLVAVLAWMAAMRRWRRR